MRRVLLSILIGLLPSWHAAQAKTLLAVFAHPDDEALVGPLLSSYARRGTKVHLIIVTQGEKGDSPHAGIPKGLPLARVRASEARCAARALGIEDPILLGFADGELGKQSQPPWAHLADVERAIRTHLSRIRPDVVITSGPEGAYGHPDHRLVGDAVTKLLAAGVDGSPAVLLYPGLPKDRMPKHGDWGDLPWSPVDSRYLTVRVPYDATDLAATRASLACHRSQFRDDEIDSETRWIHRILDGRVYLRPWFGAGQADDIFKIAIP